MSPVAAGYRRELAFAGLGLFVAFSWIGMLAEPPVARTAAACLPLLAAVAALGPLRRTRLPRRAREALAALLLVAATLAGLVIVGLPARLLLPEHWGELWSGIERGLAGIGEGVAYPYDGPNAWSRLVMLLAVPALLGVSAALTFLPLGGEPSGPRLAGLAVLVVGYATAETIYGPGQPVLRGMLLLVGLIAWLWLPTARARTALGGAVLVGVTLLAAVPVTARMQDSEALVDYRSWSWSAGEGAGFEWNHGYGPIDWERSGDTAVYVESERPNYWKASVLDRFDGIRWVRSGLVQEPLELPTEVEGLTPDWLEQDWVTTARVTTENLSSELLLGPGTGRQVTAGADAAGATADGAVLRVPAAPEKGDYYEVTGYAPDPSAERMRAAGFAVPPALFTQLELFVPERVGGPIERVNTYGIATGDAPEASRAIARSPYARVAELAEELTAGASSAYDAVKAIESHLLERYEYSESPPEQILPLSSFLFEDRAGYCQHFSGAMAMLLRMRGIPARVAAGFSPGIAEGGDRYRVRALDAHSWVEVYFAGIGWVPFDPTPPVAPAELRTGGAGAASSATGSLGAVLRGGRPFEGTLGNPDPAAAGIATDGVGDGSGAGAGGGSGLGAAPWIVTGGLLALAAALFAGPGLWRRLRERRQAPERRIELRVTELRRALDRLGFRHRPDATLRELEGSLRSRSEPLASAYVSHLRRLRYERRPGIGFPGGRERRALRRRLAGAPGGGSWLAGWRAIPPFSPRG